MTTNGWIQIGLFCLAILVCVKPLGLYMARVFDGEITFLRPVERFIYRVSGVKTFIVSHSGIVYEQDLGPKTLEQFKAMEVYNPDSTWTPVSN